MSKSNDRTSNSLRNTKTILVIYVLNTVLQFVGRNIFLHFLSVEYLGINGLFSNILSMLNLAELGIGSAMAYALYKPCAESNYELISQIMALYRRLYTAIGLGILLIGSALMPFLEFFINDPPKNVGDIRIYYLLYVFSSAVTYFVSYKRTLIVCYQKQYIITFANFVRNIVAFLLELLILACTGSFLLYLISRIASAILEDVALMLIANRMYPYVKGKKELPPSDISKAIRKNIAAMSFHKIGGVVVNGTDNIIITKFVSLTATGLYSNYAIVLTAFTSLVTQIFGAITASVGNLISLDGDNDNVYSVFKRIYFINFIIYAFAGIGVYILFNDIICLWLGNQYVLTKYAVACAVLSFITNGMRRTVLMFKDAYGLFWKDRYKPLLEALCNIALSIPLAIKYGIAGTFAGTIITNIFVSGLIESYVLFKHGLKKPIGHYILAQAVYYLFIAAAFLLLDIVSNMISFTPLVNILLKGALVIVTLVATTYAVFGRTEEWKYSMGYLKSFLHLRHA